MKALPAHVSTYHSQVNLEKVDITVFVPCLNEEQNIKNSLDVLIEAFRLTSWTYELLVVDDGSIDRTNEIVMQYMKSFPMEPISLVTNKMNMGLGYNYFSAAHLARGHFYMLINGDNDVPPETIRLMAEGMRRSELAIFYPLDSRPFFRRFLSKIFISIVQVLSGTRLRHYNSGAVYKVIDVRSWKNIAFGYGYQAEFLCALLLDPHRTYIEIPIAIQNRPKGRSKAFTFRNFASVLASLCRIFLNRWKYHLFGRLPVNSEELI